MKTHVALLLVLTLTATTVSAQYSRIIQKARSLDDKMTQRHNSADGAPPPGVAPAKPGAPATPQPAVAPLKPSTQQQAATKLKADIATARNKGEVSAEAKREFAADLKLAVLGSSRPDAEALQAFAGSFLPTVAAKGVAATGDSRLVQNIVIALNSAGLSASRLGEITSELESTLTKSGAEGAAAAKSGQDLRAIIDQIQSGGRK